MSAKAARSRQAAADVEDYDRIAEAIAWIEGHVEQQPRIADVAAHLGLSEFHFHRMFHRWAGLTPKDFLQYLTLGHAKRMLDESRSLLDTSLELGLSGPSRLHDLFVSLEAMTPGEYRSGAASVVVSWGTHGTPFGQALVGTTDRGLCHFSFLDDDAVTPEALLTSRWPGARLVEAPDRTSSVAAEVSARMRGQAAQPLGIVLKGTPFQVRVWEALISIPEGRLASYQDIAALAGAPGASRAVGTALSANPIAYLIPCHRVIQSSGSIGQYRWGLVRKRALIAVEAARSS